MNTKRLNRPNQRNIIIWGAGGHALVVADIIRKWRKWKIRGFVDDLNSQRQGLRFCSSRILKPDALDGLLNRHRICDVVIAIGGCESRLRLAEVAQAKGFHLATLIHPSTVIAPDVEIGVGTVVVAGAVINPASVIGDNVIVNTHASVDHGCTIEDGAHICPGVRLGGGVTIGRATWVGIGSTVIENIRIGSRCLVGAASLVLRDLPDGVVAYGTPAQVIRKNVTA